MCRDGFTSSFVDSVKFKRDKRMKKTLAGGIALYRVWVRVHSHPDQLSLRSPFPATYARPASPLL